MSIDGFPFVGGLPNRDGHFVAAGFTGHGMYHLAIQVLVNIEPKADILEGMPRILLSTAHITPLILDSLNAKYTPPSLVAPFPPLPKPFQVTAERIEALKKVDAAAIFEQSAKDCLESAKKPFCNNIPGHPRS